jgi:hypothetical protein
MAAGQSGGGAQRIVGMGEDQRATGQYKYWLGPGTPPKFFCFPAGGASYSSGIDIHTCILNSGADTDEANREPAAGKCGLCKAEPPIQKLVRASKPAIYQLPDGLAYILKSAVPLSRLFGIASLSIFLLLV